MTLCHIVGACAVESVVTKCEGITFEIAEIMEMSQMQVTSLSLFF